MAFGKFWPQVVQSRCATANIFVGQTEAPLAIKPYLGRMTQSDFCCHGGRIGFDCGQYAGYASMGIDLRFLLAACFMAAPAGLLFAKLLIPETETTDNSELKRILQTTQPTSLMQRLAVPLTGSSWRLMWEPCS